MNGKSKNVVKLAVILVFSLLFGQDSTIKISGLISNLGNEQVICYDNIDSFDLIFSSGDGEIYYGEPSYY